MPRYSATSAQAAVQGVEPRKAVLETACLPASTLLWPPALGAESRRNDYFSNSTFQYASLTNFDQLSIRTSWNA